MSHVDATRMYCFDTSSLIQAWERNYPIAHFPSFWSEIDHLVANSRLVATQEVCEELTRKSTGLHGWCVQRPRMFIEHTELIMRNVRTILTQFPTMVDSAKGRSGGDPFVVALAMTNGYVVITEEQGGQKRQKIPEVCHALGMPCARLLDVIKRENWRF